MATIATDSEIVKEVITYYSKLRPSHGDIRLDTVFDDNQGHYALMQVGWDRGRRIRGNLIYITVKNGKVFIEYDGMESGIVEDLVKRGITKDRIVLAYLPEEKLMVSV